MDTSFIVPDYTLGRSSSALHMEATAAISRYDARIVGAAPISLKEHEDSGVSRAKLDKYGGM